MKLTEMDERIRQLERQAASGDEDAASRLHQLRIKGLSGWRKQLHDYLEQAESSIVTQAILPDLIAKTLPEQVKIGLIESIMHELFPDIMDQLEPLIQEALGGNWQAYRQALSKFNPQLVQEKPGLPTTAPWWNSWDDGSYASRALIESWIRIELYRRTKNPDYRSYINSVINKLYYGEGGNQGLQNMLMDHVRELVYGR